MSDATADHKPAVASKLGIYRTDSNRPIHFISQLSSTPSSKQSHSNNLSNFIFRVTRKQICTSPRCLYLPLLSHALLRPRLETWRPAPLEVSSVRSTTANGSTVGKVLLPRRNTLAPPAVLLYVFYFRASVKCFPSVLIQWNPEHFDLRQRSQR